MTDGNRSQMIAKVYVTIWVKCAKMIFKINFKYLPVT